MTSRPSPTEDDLDFALFLNQLELGGKSKIRLLALEEDRAVVAFSWNQLALVVKYDETRFEEQLVDMRNWIRGLPFGNLGLVVLGGDKRIRKRLQKLRPFLQIQRVVNVFHLDDRRKLWGGQAIVSSGRLYRQLKSFRKATFEPVDDSVLQRLAQTVPESRDHLQEMREFYVRMKKRPAWAVWSLFALAALLFVLQFVWGAPGFVPTLVQMGGNVPAESLGAEPYRLISALFLHGSVDHFLGNMLVLLTLGLFLERLLGFRRFIILFAGAGLLGNLASSLFSGAFVSVGASSALWGLLAASALLAFRARDLLPEMLVVGLKRHALITLVINVLVSFHPQVDLFAHLGGGLAGLLLIASGVLLPRPFKREEGGSAPVPQLRLEHHRSWLSPVAGLSGCLLLVCPIVALAQGTPWTGSDPSWVSRQLGQSGRSIELPAVIADQQQVKAMPSGFENHLFGRVGVDPIMVEIVVGKVPADELAVPRQFAETIMQSSWNNLPPELKPRGDIREMSGMDHPTFAVQLTAKTGGAIYQWVQILPEQIVFIIALKMPNTPKRLRTDYERLIRSLK